MDPADIKFAKKGIESTIAMSLIIKHPFVLVTKEKHNVFMYTLSLHCYCAFTEISGVHFTPTIQCRVSLRCQILLQTQFNYAVTIRDHS